MLGPFAAWIRSHKAIASTVAIALVASVPVTFAVLHKGFPTDDVNLNSRDVWVTNGDKLMLTITHVKAGSTRSGGSQFFITVGTDVNDVSESYGLVGN